MCVSVTFVVVCSFRLTRPTFTSVFLEVPLGIGSFGPSDDCLNRLRHETPPNPPRPDNNMADELVTEMQDLLRVSGTGANTLTSSNSTDQAQKDKKPMADPEQNVAEGNTHLT